MPTRSVVAVAVASLAPALGACGGGDGKKAPTTHTAPAPAVTDTVPSDTGTAPAVTQTNTAPAQTGTSTSPEKQPGGAGDEQPARTLALFMGKNGRITPSVIRVPAFISIRVELRSADGRDYGLRFGGKTIKAAGGLSSASTTFDGLRPGARLVGTSTGASNSVRVEATAEPGP